MSVRGVVKNLLAGRDEVEAGEERSNAARLGTAQVADLAARRHGIASGVLRSVMLRPTSTVKAVEAELYDGSGSLDLVWLGRRRIPGIEPGRRVRVEGFVSIHRGRRVMYNPRYELLPGSHDAA